MKSRPEIKAVAATLKALAKLLDSCSGDPDDDDKGLAGEIMRVINSELESRGVAVSATAFVRTSLIVEWLEEHEIRVSGHPMAFIRNLAKAGLLPAVDPVVKRWPSNGSDRHSGILLNKRHGADVITITPGVASSDV